MVALECARWFIQNGKKDKIIGFAVTDMEDNPERLEGLAVKKLEEYENQNKSLTVIIAVPEKYHGEIEDYVKKKGFRNVVKIGLGDMEKLKCQRFLKIQNNYQQIGFLLEIDNYDSSWLNMLEKKNKACYCKFPTLFYLDEDRIFTEAVKLDFYENYKKVCGQYRSLHMFPDAGTQNGDGRELKKIINIYMVFSMWDSAKVNIGQYAPWIYPIQVGCRLSGQRYGKIFDDLGDNISEKNAGYAEMTGAYWVWKNVSGVVYKGLCHYRRHFVVSEVEIRALERNGIDVILTVPRYVPGGIKNMFFAETPVKRTVYEGMLRSISEVSPEDREGFELYLNCNMYYPNNMLVAKEKIYDAYCSWIFPILFEMEEIDKEIGYGHEKDRHIAYASELLTSFYFVKNRDKYCIVTTDYCFYS